MYVGSPDGILRPLMVPVTQSISVPLPMRHGLKVQRRQRNQRVLHYGLHQNKNRGNLGQRVGYTSPSPNFGDISSRWQYEGIDTRKNSALGCRFNTDRQFAISNGIDSCLPLNENLTFVNSFPTQHLPLQSGHYANHTEIPQSHAYQTHMSERFFYQKPILNPEVYFQPYPGEHFWDPGSAYYNRNTPVQFYRSPISEQFAFEENCYSSPSTDSVYFGNTEEVSFADFESAESTKGNNPDLVESASDYSSNDKGQGQLVDRPISEGEAVAETISNALIATALGHGALYNTDDVMEELTNVRQELNGLVTSTIQAKISLEEIQFSLAKEEEKKQERIRSSWKLQNQSSTNGPSVGSLPVNGPGAVRRSRRILQRRSKATVSYGTDYDMDEMSEEEREDYGIVSAKPANVNNNSIFWVKVLPPGSMPLTPLMWPGH